MTTTPTYVPTYVVCNKLLDAETNEFCEFDGVVGINEDGSWRCPSCSRVRWAR